jgi:hypothetical protein
MKKIVNPLTPGDVIRTHPGRKYWGCAIVLSARDSTTEFHPMCHIATTTLIRPRKYAWEEIDASELEVATIVPEIRVAPNEYVASETRVCIGIYSLKSADNLDIVGRVNPKEIYDRRLTFKVGDGTAGTFPLCGPIPDDLGYEAVVVWRQIHDAARLKQEERKSNEWFEAYEAERLAKARKARQARAVQGKSVKPKKS